MLRIMAILFGIGFIFAGVAGFLPSFTTDNLLLGYFEVDGMHNIAHITSGVLAIMAATSLKYTRWYFQLFGIIYALLGIVGFWRGGDLYFMTVNFADNILHSVIGVLALYLGFFFKSKETGL